MTLPRKDDLDHVEKTIKELETSINKIKHDMKTTDFRAQIFLVKLKYEKLRAMEAVARSQSILATMDIMLAKTEIGLEVNNIKSSSSLQTSSNKKKTKSKCDEPSSKKLKLTPEREPVPQKVTHHHSKRQIKENQKEESSSKRQDKDPRTNTNAESPKSPSLPCSIPLKNLSNIWPVHKRKTVFLNNPPVRNSKVKKNVGYFSTTYANEVLGYNPDKMPVAQANNIELSSSDSNFQSMSATNLRIHRAYNLSVTPGYHLNVVPGFVLQHPSPVHSHLDSDAQSSRTNLPDSKCSTPKQTKTKIANDHVTNELFRDLLCNKNSQTAEKDIRSLTSIDTLVITTNLKTDFI